MSVRQHQLTQEILTLKARVAELEEEGSKMSAELTWYRRKVEGLRAGLDCDPIAGPVEGYTNTNAPAEHRETQCPWPDCEIGMGHLGPHGSRHD
jgi:hypothetical protein